MDWTMVAAVGEILGALAVVASLVYVGRQVSQSAKSGRAAAQEKAINAVQEVSFRIVSDPTLLDVWNRGLEDPSSLHTEELIRFYYLTYNWLKAFEEIHFHQVQGELDPQTWAGFRVVISTYVTSPGVKAYFELRKGMFPARFSDLVTELQSEGGPARLGQIVGQSD